ncbi:MAG: hypothetical protein B7Y47_07070 [Sphingomonas sp. 28-63-12]|nr:MAG: hypothetical protein B7Y47_07070 [Sphingomonas sp. 28-63-12]
MTPAILIALALAVPIAPATAATRVKVTRFHLGTPISPAPISIQTGVGNDPQSLEQQQFATAVAAELDRLGFTHPANAGSDGDSSPPLLATVTVKRESREETAANKPLTIGIGGGGYGGNVGGGIGVGFGIGKRATRTFYTTELAVQIRRRADGGAIWEGRAVIEVNARSRDAQPDILVNKLAQALFRGFPGESGRTITVK